MPNYIYHKVRLMFILFPVVHVKHTIMIKFPVLNDLVVICDILDARCKRLGQFNRE